MAHPMAYVLFLQHLSVSCTSALIPGQQSVARVAIHQHGIKSQLVLHGTPSGSRRINLRERHEGIKRREAEVEVLSPFRPVQRIIWIVGRAWLQDDLGISLVVGQQSFEANSAWRKVRVLCSLCRAQHLGFHAHGEFKALPTDNGAC